MDPTPTRAGSTRCRTGRAGGLGHVLTPTDGPLVMQRAAMGDGPSGAFLAGGVAAALVSTREDRTRVGRRRGAARHRGVDARARPRRDHDPAHRPRAARRRHGALEPADRPVPDGRRPLAAAQHDGRRPALGAHLPCAGSGTPPRRRPVRRHRRARRPPRGAARRLRGDHRRGPLRRPPRRPRGRGHDLLRDGRAHRGDRGSPGGRERLPRVSPEPRAGAPRVGALPVRRRAARDPHGAPAIGEHTDTVLAEAGFDADEIRALHETGAIA